MVMADGVECSADSGAVFIGAAFVAQRPPGWLENPGMKEEVMKALLWLAAMIAALPLFVATLRKLQALGRLVAETNVAPGAAGGSTPAIRRIVAQVIPLAGIVALGLYVLLLSSPLLAPVDVLVVLAAVVALVAWLLGRASAQVYSMAQDALQETLAQEPPPSHDVASAPMPSMFAKRSWKQ
jgi:K+:H+ antiporter